MVGISYKVSINMLGKLILSYCKTNIIPRNLFCSGLELFLEVCICNGIDLGAKYVEVLGIEFIIAIMPFDNWQVVYAAVVTMIEEVDRITEGEAPNWIR